MKDNNQKRKILKDRTFPDTEQINKHQNFDRITKEYSLIKKIIMKKIIIWSVAILGIAGIVGLVLNNKNTNTQLNTNIVINPQSKLEAYIQPPLPGSEVPFINYRISAKNGGVINYPTGSSITIPANAFVNKSGKPVSDSIDIRYREFHNPLEIFLSGIPMHYDSAGTKNTLESAGMLEILALDKGVNLRLNEQTPIKIKMASTNNEGRFNLYELDTITKNWIYKGKDKIEKLEVFNTVRNKKERKEPKNVANTIIKPTMSDPQKYSFKIGYDKNDFPELAAYEKVVFEVTDNNFKPAYFKINWNKISLYNGDEYGHYIIKLKKADTTISVTARPVFDKADYSNALIKFEEEHKQSAKERDQKDLAKQAVVDKVNKEIEARNANQMLAAAGRLAGMLAYRTFPITALGIHNSDFPMPPILAYAISIKRAAGVQRKTEAVAKLAYNTIFLIEKGKNTVFRFFKGESVRCDPNAKNLMWTLTEKNEVAFFRITDYSKLSNGSENNINPVVAKNQELALNEIKRFSE